MVAPTGARTMIAAGAVGRGVTWRYYATADVLTVTWACGCGARCPGARTFGRGAWLPQAVCRVHRAGVAGCVG